MPAVNKMLEAWDTLVAPWHKKKKETEESETAANGKAAAGRKGRK